MLNLLGVVDDIGKHAPRIFGDEESVIQPDDVREEVVFEVGGEFLEQVGQQQSVAGLREGGADARGEEVGEDADARRAESGGEESVQDALNGMHDHDAGAAAEHHENGGRDQQFPVRHDIFAYEPAPCLSWRRERGGKSGGHFSLTRTDDDNSDDEGEGLRRGRQ